MNRNLTTGLLAASLALAAAAQDKPAARVRPLGKPAAKTQDELIERRTEKLAKPVFMYAPWITDYDEARATAAKNDKLIFVYFTRSYAG